MSAAGAESTTPGQEHKGRGQLGGDTGEHAGQKAAVIKAMAPLGRRAEAAALSSALATVAGSGRGVQGLTTTTPPPPRALHVFWQAIACHGPPAIARVGRACLLRMGQWPQGRKLWAQMMI